MIFKKTFMLNLLGAMAVSTICSAQETQSPEVIYKIHNVNPIKEDNKIVSCDYSVTFFNRAPEMVSNLSVNFTWQDNIIDEQIKAEKQEKVVDSQSKVTGYTGKSKTEEYTSKKISQNVSVPPLPASKQVSIKLNIKTDRCFLLLQKPELEINSCRYGNANSERNAGACQNMFTYISPAQGDYYSEFKPISYDNEQEEKDLQNQKEKQELEEIYNNALDSVKRINQTLDSMK